MHYTKQFGKLTSVQWILGPSPSSFKLTKGLCTSIRIRQPIRKIFLYQSRYQWCVPVENNCLFMYILLIKSTTALAETWWRKCFWDQREVRHENMVVHPILNVIWNMSHLTRNAIEHSASAWSEKITNFDINNSILIIGDTMRSNMWPCRWVGSLIVSDHELRKVINLKPSSTGTSTWMLKSPQI